MLTKKEQQGIVYLRSGNMSYTKIALLLNLTREDVRGYCVEQNVNGDADKIAAQVAAKKKRKKMYWVCEYCGVIINTNPFKRGKKRRFCSEWCRRRWWAEHPDKQNRRESAFYHFTCKMCKKEFTAYGNKNRQFCSVSCAVNYRYYDK